VGLRTAITAAVLYAVLAAACVVMWVRMGALESRVERLQRIDATLIQIRDGLDRFALDFGRRLIKVEAWRDGLDHK